MTEPLFPDELLMRYVDGEVDDATAARIEAALADDPGLVARIEIFARTRALAHDAYAPLLDEPVPEALQDRIRAMIARHEAPPVADNVVALAARRPARQRGFGALPLAASVALALALGFGGYWLGARNAVPPAEGLAIGQSAPPALAGALSDLASGADADLPGLGHLRLTSAFRDGQGKLCREAELEPGQGAALALVACHGAQGWVTTLALAAPGDDKAYVPASASDALDAYLEAIEAGAPLSDAEERAALSALR